MQLEGWTRSARHAAVPAVRDAIDATGGSILDHQQFSNRVLRLTIELPAAHLERLVTALEEVGVALSRPTVEDAEATTLGS